MTDISSASGSPEPEINAEELLQLLLHKEGTWVEWGKACQQLQKAGYNPQRIFEETGFEPTQQNQITVASQVYTSLVDGNSQAIVLDHFKQKGSDSLYELRILNQSERVAAAELLVTKNIDSVGSREVSKAIKEFSRMTSLPEGFSSHGGDAVAYQCWKLARQQEDLQERARLIARGLNFAHSQTARQKIEQLLTDFTVAKGSVVPPIPVYRLESETELPRILPVVGKFPLTLADMQAVPLIEEIGPFRLVKFSLEGAWVPIPGWQVVLSAEDPVVILSDSDRLVPPLPGKPEEVLVIVDRAQRQWDANSYFIVEQADKLEIQSFEEAPDLPLLGRIILVVRPKKILDEELTKELWQIDE
ncbi:MAG: hypothetical protein DSM106950_35925 [Stigonema ocellatum SAG 48.90 = DSM 106950]|nr:hypothetical protein [Stigonema ocellatum SAG 48.90 = DSM 106950]